MLEQNDSDLHNMLIDFSVRNAGFADELIQNVQLFKDPLSILKRIDGAFIADCASLNKAVYNARVHLSLREALYRIIYSEAVGTAESIVVKQTGEVAIKETASCDLCTFPLVVYDVAFLPKVVVYINCKHVFHMVLIFILEVCGCCFKVQDI